MCGAHWVAWDLRQPGLSPPPQIGPGHATGGTGFRWSPTRNAFATSGSTNELSVHTLHMADSGPGAWSVVRDRLSHELPTRVAALSWLHVAAEPVLAACADTKVCIWSVGGPERALA